MIAAGERWGTADGRLRPVVEDLLGAGAVLHALDPSAAASRPHCSAEARAARAAFLEAKPDLLGALTASASGRELIGRGWNDDVETAAAFDASSAAAQLIGGAFVAV